LALRHHPDKSVNALSFVNSSLAFQSVLNAAGGDGLIARTSEALRSDADRIFKLLGESNACLSDPVRFFKFPYGQLVIFGYFWLFLVILVFWLSYAHGQLD
jgi:hypothetical protein